MPTTPASKASVRTGRSAPLSPGSIEPKTQTVYTLKESLGTPRQLSKVKAEEDECLVDPPQQDSLEQLVEQMEPNSQLHEGEEEAADEDDDDKVAQPPIEDDGEDEEDGMQMDASNVEGGEVLEGGKVCGSKACVEQAIPCPPCAKHNKGIAACFAQGHLYMTIKGEVPSSCKDCKQRNKGALFCFKRGHMVKLRAMLGATSPKSVPLHAGTTLPALNSKEAEDVGGDKMDEGSDVGPDADAPNASDALDLDNHVNDDDMSGPVSPQDECSL